MKNAAHLDPFTANREVTSAKHKSPYLEEDSEPTEKVFNVTDFVQYYSFMPVAPAAADAIDWFYAVENTTELQPLGEIKAQFYGNTTYIQIETVYTPDHTEVYDFVKNLVTNKYEMKLLAATEGTPWTGTFWSYGTGAARVLLNEDPKSDEADPQIIADLVDLATAEILEYKDGKNYHKFPVQDPGETAGLYKNRVLRNHYYSYDVEGIVDLGSNTSDVDPTEPIEGETWLRIKVEVAPWDKVTNGSIVL
jgi:hypothetical protein